jgi:multicomponent Na+:H+ antiporter subunit E
MSRARPWNLLAWIWLALVFLRELTLSAIDVIRATLARDLDLRPGIVAVPLRLRSPAGVTLLSHMVTLTPGTTSLHVSPDRTMLYVHAMNAADPDAVCRTIADRLEAPTMRVLP